MITAYVGANGSGKSLLAVSDAIDETLRMPGRPLYSTVPIDYDSKRGSVHSIPITSWQQLLDLDGGHVLLDEVATLASSRETNSLPPEVLAWMGSLRHTDTTLAWTAPAWARADVVLRESTQLVKEIVPKVRHRKKGQRWRVTLLSLVRTYRTDAGQGGDFPKDDDRQGRAKFMRLRKQLGFGAYPTLHQVVRLSEFGAQCSICGKRKRVEYCRCPAHD